MHRTRHALHAIPILTLLFLTSTSRAGYERINTPNTVGPQNWSWRLPWSLHTMDREDHVAGALDDLASLARRTNRLGR